MKFYPIEIPLAIHMITLSKKSSHPFQIFFCLWSAFNNIYVQIGKQRGLEPKLKLNGSGKVIFVTIERYEFPSVEIPQEYKLIDLSVTCLSEETQDLLIRHENTNFFVNRKPYGINENIDSISQLINGVLNITRTVNYNYPVWSPIHKQHYIDYLKGNLEQRFFLTKQIVFLLYTIRNNLIHGGKNPDESNDMEVVQNAIPLMNEVVSSFII